MKKLIALSALILAGCAGTPKTGKSLLTECVNTGEVAPFTIMIRSPDVIQDIFNRTPRSSRTSVVDQTGAFTGVNADGQITLVLPPLRGQYDRERMALWGHELAHIICGSFHDNP